MPEQRAGALAALAIDALEDGEQRAARVVTRALAGSGCGEGGDLGGDGRLVDQARDVLGLAHAGSGRWSRRPYSQLRIRAMVAAGPKPGLTGQSAAPFARADFRR
jgi:hypothetical protein